MKEIALIGTKLIHTYPYVVHFNGSDERMIKRNAKPWMQEFMLGRDLSPKTDRLRVTRVWSPDVEENKRLAETFKIEKVCDSADEALDGADAVMVMDEIIESRTKLVEKALSLGLDVFADKVPSLDTEKTKSLIALAEEKGAVLRSWSQLYFDPRLDAVRQAGPGGVGFINFKIAFGKRGLDNLRTHGIHAISMLQAAFGKRVRNYLGLDDASGRLALLRLAGGTRVFVYLGEDVPPEGRVYYCSRESDVVINGELDEWACFLKAAETLAALFTRAADIPHPGPEDMVEASLLMECLLDEQKTGRPVSLAD